MRSSESPCAFGYIFTATEPSIVTITAECAICIPQRRIETEGAPKALAMPLTEILRKKICVFQNSEQ